MKRIRILFSFLIAILIATNAFSYEIQIEDLHVHEFTDGKYMKEGLNYKVVYDVNEEKGVITEKTVSSEERNANMPNVMENPYYKILNKKEGVLTAIRNWETGVEILTFYRDGIYYFLQTREVYDEEQQKTSLNSVLSFGRYSIDLRYLP
ncbi:hypothetical protein ACFL0P_03880 [Candidatus Omnitrophota bacterium]